MMAIHSTRRVSLAVLLIFGGGCVVVHSGGNTETHPREANAAAPKPDPHTPAAANPATSRPTPAKKPKPANKPKPKPKPHPKPKPKPKPKPEPKPRPDVPPPTKPDVPPAKPDVPPPTKPDVPPTTKPDVPPPGVSKDTQIVVPVRVAFADALARVDALVQQTAQQDWQTVSAPGDLTRVEVKYKVWRDPIEASFADQTLKVRVDVHYAANVRASTKNPLGGRIWITRGESWGTRSEPQELSATFHARLDVEDDFSVKATAELDAIEHGPAPSGEVCVQALARLCISKELVAPRVRKNLEQYLVPRIKKALGDADRQVERALNLKRQAGTLWTALQRPQPLAKPGQIDCPGEVGALCTTPAWLVAQPTAIGVSQPRLDGKDLRVDLAIDGKLAVKLGSPPKVKPTPLPKLSPVTGTPGFAVRAQLHVPVASFGDELDRLVKDRHLGGRGGSGVVVTGVRLIDDPDPGHPRRLKIEVTVSGALDATLELQGELVYDAKKGVLSLHDLEYTLDSDNQALQRLSAANHAALRELIAERAAWKLDTRTAALAKAVTGALGGVWRGHLKVDGELSQVQLESFAIDRGTLTAEVVLAGRLAVALTP